jgi:hypothetical protein
VQKLEAAGSSGAVQALGMENDAPLLARMHPPLIPKWSNWTLRPRGLESANFRFARDTIRMIQTPRYVP